MLLTIFTPTYNRDYTLPRLYASLCKQTCRDFEWIVVDDGSTDGTSDLINGWILEKRIDLRYYHKKNGGKPSAYNVGAVEARGEIFTCVDSDDFLKENAVDVVIRGWKADVQQEAIGKKIIGQIYAKIREDGSLITECKSDTEYATLLEFYRKHGLSGDTMLVYRTEIVKKHLFPIFDNEKFVPESFIYDRYDDEGVLHLMKEEIYVVEYLENGYSASMRKVNHDNPRGYEAFVKQRLGKDNTIQEIFTDLIRYTAIKFVLRDGRILADNRHKLLTILSIIPGWIFYRKEYYRYDHFK